MYDPRELQSLQLEAIQLQKLRQEYAALRRSSKSINASVDRSLREIRLKKLFARVRKILATKLEPRHPKKEPSQELRYQRLTLARQKGNAYGEIARKQIAEEAAERKPSFIDLQSLNFRGTTYGNYYSARNRLLWKDIVGEYDKEFHCLLLKCAVFEKEHEDVRGFLDKKILCDTGFSLATDESTSKVDVGNMPKSASEDDVNSLHKEIGVQVSHESLPKDTVLFSQAKAFVDKVSEESCSENSDDKSNNACDIERIGDQN